MGDTRALQPTNAGPARHGFKRFIPLLLVVVAVALVGVVERMKTDVEQPPAAEVPPVNVTVELVQAIPELPDTLDLTAVIEPNRVVNVAAEVSGQIEQFGQRQDGAVLQEGEPVSKGQPIIHLNKDLLQAAYDRALAQYDYDEREYERILGLYESGATSKTELDDAGTRRQVSRASLAEATRQLERTTIAAPINGILNRLPREVGEYVVPGDDVAEIVDIDTVKIAVDVPERDVHCFHVGDHAAVLLQGDEQEPTAGDITYISALADEGTRTTRLEITVPNRDHGLRSGQIARARLTRRVLQDAIMIPLDAVIPLEEGRVVYVVNDDHAERRVVELGFIKGHRVRVLGGLGAGDRLIVAGHRYVGPGQTVNVVDNDAAGASPEREVRIGAGHTGEGSSDTP